MLLISREGKNISENLKRSLLTNLQNLVYEYDFEVRSLFFLFLQFILKLRFVLCELTMTFIQTNCFKSSEDIQFLIFFLLKQNSIHEEEIKEKVK